MAFSVRGGGEQTVGPLYGEGKRAYCVHHSGHRQDRDQALAEKRRRTDAYETSSDDFGELRAQHYEISRLGLPSLAAGTSLPDCDIPYPSIEPRDTPAPGEELPDFFILHEAGFEESVGFQREFSSQSPMPYRSGFSLVSESKDWANGASLKASDVDELYLSAPARTSKPPRYEDWRDRNATYDMVTGQEEYLRSFSPFIMLPLSNRSRRTPESVEYSPQHQSSDDGRYMHGARESVIMRGHEHCQRENIYPVFDQRTETKDMSPISCTVRDSGTHNVAENLMTDSEAAASVSIRLANFNRRHPSSRHERILIGLIHPKSVNAEFELDNSALRSIFSSANEIFFNGRLTQRVQWDWSDEKSNPQYDNKIIGHTSLRRARGGGFETFILLSTPILRSREYSRRLLISAFLHELIHCYLFICCGWSAREEGGHTEGFRRIADTIDRWAGRENLYLCQVEADLEQFRQPARTVTSASPSSPSFSSTNEESHFYSGFSVASPVFYTHHVCHPTETNSDWEQDVKKRWDRHHDGQSDRSYVWP